MLFSFNPNFLLAVLHHDNAFALCEDVSCILPPTAQF
jgi:hypothetical protein